MMIRTAMCRVRDHDLCPGDGCDCPCHTAGLPLFPRSPSGKPRVTFPVIRLVGFLFLVWLVVFVIGILIAEIIKRL